MNLTVKTRLLRGLLAILLIPSAPAFAAADPFATPDSPQTEFLKVDQAYRSNVSINSGALQVDWQIAPEYYLYKEKFELKLQSANGKPLSADISYPTGVMREDPYFGTTEVYYSTAALRATPLPDSGTLELRMRSQGCADAGLCYPPQTHNFFIDIDRGTVTALGTKRPQALKPPVEQAAALPAAAPGITLMFVYALLGGMILNLMPCVFPVLGLKVLSFTQAGRQKALAHSLSYSAGVIASFLIVALTLMTIKSSGQAIGWGFQLQNSRFVALLALLFFALALSMLGYIHLMGRWMGWGDKLTQGSGHRASFFTGVLATVVASPCTAPFMGVALGFALSQSTAVALWVFFGLGLGMALPMIALTAVPGLLEKIPGPGQWMQTLQQFLAFPLLATSLWLAWVAGRQTGVNGFALIIGLFLLLSFGLWCRQLQSPWRIVGSAVIAASLLLALFIPLPEAKTVADTDTQWSQQRVESLRQSGRAVFVDVTADWCITCKVNEALVLNTAEVRDAYKQAGVVWLIADWTHYDPRITSLVERYARGGAPLYLFYPADPRLPAIVLPQILSKEIMLSQLSPPTS